jgi:hypothetical protein
VTTAWRDGLTMVTAIFSGAAVQGFTDGPWWVGSLVSVGVWVGLRTIWHAPMHPDRGNQREETGKAERSDQQER